MSKVVKRTDPSNGDEDVEATQVIDPESTRHGSTSPVPRPDPDATQVIPSPADDLYRDDTRGSAAVERTQVIDSQEATRQFDNEQMEREAEARRRREQAEERARERAERERALGLVPPPAEPDPVVVENPRPSTDRAWPSIGLFLFRLVVAAIMGIHGVQHLMHRDLTLQAVQATSWPYASYLVWVLGIAECLAALALLFGLLTRVAGLGVAAVAILALAYVRWGNFDIIDTIGFSGELEVLLAASGLLLFFVGSGGWALDARARRRRAERKARD